MARGLAYTDTAMVVRVVLLLACASSLGACKVKARGQSLAPGDPSAPAAARAADDPVVWRGPSPAGRHTQIRVEDLPAPRVGPLADNPPREVARPLGAGLRVPEGFSIAPFAEGGFDDPRWMALAPNGDVFLADSRGGSVWLLRDTTGKGKADVRHEFLAGLTQPFGLAFHDGWLYVGDTDEVLRFRYVPGQTSSDRQRGELVTRLPGHGYHQHWTRNVVFSPDGTKLYVSVGSQTNDGDDPEPRASILVMNPDGSDRHVLARGLRNPVGMAFNPVTGALWAAVEERDDMGDDLVPDYVTEVKPGAFYGWPFAYIGPHEDPSHQGERPDLVARTVVPDVLVQAHSAVLGLVFYDGSMFPAEYRGDALVALHGSWNRSRRTGYKVIRIRFREGRPVGGYDDFVEGWMASELSRDVWGRPVGLLVAGDGALLVADDAGKLVWRVSYAR
jgi:glucose/arabinose dehydrogenase